MNRRNTLSLGPDLVQLLIPHRRPFLMVDRVTAYEPGEQPLLRAERQVSANEEVFAGHFPHLHLWPGVHTIEGMGQSCNLLQVLESMRERWVERGGTVEEILRALRNLELGFTLHPGFRPDDAAATLARIPPAARNLGVSAGVEVKLLHPVFAGQRLDYEVRRTHVIGELVRYEVQAEVEDRLVATGVMTAKLGFALPGLPPGA